MNEFNKNIKEKKFEMTQKGFNEIFHEIAQRDPERLAIVYKDRNICFSELVDSIDTYARYLSSVGVREGSHVALFSFNSPEYLIAFYAIIRLGAVATLLNYSLNTEQVVSQCKLTDISCFIYGDTRLTEKEPDAILNIKSELGLEENVFISLNEDINVNSDIVLPEEPTDSKRNAFIIFTSGTSSEPKAVLLSQYGFINNALSVYDRLKDRFNDKLMVAVPMFHIFGLQMANIALLNNAAAYLPNRFNAETLLDMIEKFEIDAMATVGAVYNALIDAPKFYDKASKIVRLGFIAGGFSTPVQFLRMETSFEDIRIINAYGQTETSPCISMHMPNMKLENRIHNVGLPLPGVELQIVDSEGNVVPQGTVGEIVVRGYLCMNGYYKLPKESQPIDEKGWLHTGDLGLINHEGMIILSGRIKDIIIKSGENILPVEIEKVISSHPLVKNVKIFGAHHLIWGESIEACVVLSDDAKTENIDETLSKYVKSRLGSFKVPSHFFVFDKFPLTANGKPDVRTLKTKMLNMLKDVVILKELKKGIPVISMTVKSLTGNILPVTDTAHRLAVSMNYDAESVHKITMAVREMFTERIQNAYADLGDISITFTLMKNWVQIKFRDQGLPFSITENYKNRPGTRKMLFAADNYLSRKEKDGSYAYYIDFEYADGFNVKEFLKNE